VYNRPLRAVDVEIISTTFNVFDTETRYLYDNGFKVLTYTDLGYDTIAKVCRNEYLFHNLKLDFHSWLHFPPSSLRLSQFFE
jgi:hypothetical protein